MHLSRGAAAAALPDRARPADTELLALHAPEGLGLGVEREPAGEPATV
jgi:hypothetical protein